MKGEQVPSPRKDRQIRLKGQALAAMRKALVKAELLPTEATQPGRLGKYAKLADQPLKELGYVEIHDTNLTAAPNGTLVILKRRNKLRYE